LADDSGLEVDALEGAPGVHSARFAALDSGQPGNSLTAENNAKLLRLLRDIPLEKRTARFRCVLALTPVVGCEAKQDADEVKLQTKPLGGVRPATPSLAMDVDEVEAQTKLFEGACNGTIGVESRGRGGFGYDPLFFPARYSQTFGELSEEVKNRLSHRAKALQMLRAYLAGNR
jgi:XTP/dITP diphosphohydrolase